jgi:predicted small lipoprotein YifL
MKTRLIQMLALLALLAGTGLAGAAETATLPQAGAESQATTTQTVDDRDRIAWQRVGAPLTVES